ncbi:MBL fold metallo-hydrolase RNA specificity domain-containing protein [Vibrio algarum]|uniref:MBL fold metallo-hydrolase n=1 Tax=Vibrio algarum TaxID=3020714 RepID=A0ABT4YLW2_9VIBR|nr:MBL fold metallo-hydrolase [Vibrio sp. KJ40-1]MDB1122400.1 MBL fold metallo-hydrolase [Vibrio sp. KJ40-1]
MKVIHHGGKDTVTGSCHELFYSPKRSVLIDCGQFQGEDVKPLAIRFPVHQISTLIITHAHIDHIGRLPWLLAAGYSGPIYCTAATAELMPLMLDDGLKLQLGMKRSNRESILALVKRRIKTIDYGRWQRVSAKDGVSKDYCYIRLNPAGHILGSAYVEIKLSDDSIVVFTGDLGASNTPLLPDPISPQRADYLFIESTYGNRCHEDVKSRSSRLKEIITRSLRDGGTILIPAFSVGRTQELLFDIEQLIYQSELEADIPIILDSPMAQKVTKSYRRFKKLWGKEAKQKISQGRHPLAFKQCIQIDNYPSHQRLVNRLASSGEPAIVVAASGMCEGGRIVGYLKALLSDKRTDIVFAGYQAKGTLGQTLQSRPERVWIDGDEIEVKAQIHTMSGYSAHADNRDLHAFVDEIEVKPQEIHLIHGEFDAQLTFANELVAKDYSVV